MKRAVIWIVSLLALAGVVGYIATSGGFSERETGGGGGEALSTTAPRGGGGGGGGAKAVPAGIAPDEAGVIGDLGVIPEIGPDIVKTGEISIVVKRGTFAGAFQQAIGVAGKYAGFVESSSTSGSKARSGYVVIRIPNSSFEQALAELRGIGDSRGESVSGQDVTSQFVDLNARLRTWEAQESVLIDLMSQATTVQGTLQVQRELQDVQLRIEQIKGQLRVLGDQVAMSTIRVDVREAGAPVTPETADTRPSLAEAWTKAIDGLLGVLYAVVVGLGYLLPIGVIGLLGMLVYRRVSRERTAPVAPPAS